MIAYPTKPDDCAFASDVDATPGLTKREWFAGHILAGIALWDRNGTTDIYCDAAVAVSMADALIAALNRDRGQVK